MDKGGRMKIYDVYIKGGIVGMFHEPQDKWKAKNEKDAIDKQYKRDKSFYRKHGITKDMLGAKKVDING